MRKLFYAGLLGLILFEIAHVYFIMPMPGSQEMNSIDLAYFLHRWRWVFRVTFCVAVLAGLFRSSRKKPWTWAVPLVLASAITYVANFRMAADQIFHPPKEIIMVAAENNKVDSSRLVIGVVNNGEARAYPIRFLGYHHHLIDTVGGKPLLVTYCTVCRTGRVYEPLVNGKPETFRLVGMDHYNAMLEDEGSGSWWRQATGEAITGALKGSVLPEVQSSQTTLATWLQLYPGSRIMQEDPAFRTRYDSTDKFETGKSKSRLTGTDSLSWKRKSWVVGLTLGGSSKAYDWNELKAKKMIMDRVNDQEVMLVLGGDNKSFFAFEKPDGDVLLVNDTLVSGQQRWLLSGKSITGTADLKQIPAYQEFWHSWQQFHPGTAKK